MNAAAGRGWSCGDRLPDVRLRSADGESQLLHTDCAGTPLWLCVSAAAAMPSLPTPSDGLHALLIRPTRVGALDEAELAGTRWQQRLVDPGWCAELAPDCLWITDANLRLQSQHALPLAVPPLVTGMSTPAPVLQIPNVFEAGFCRELMAHLDDACGGGDASGVVVLEDGAQTFQLDPSIKQRRESPPRDPALEARMHERMGRRVLPEILRAFNFHVARRDPFKLLAYPENAGYFRPHRDNDTPDVAHRRFALSVNLNTGGYAGGEFRFPEFGPERFSPPVGGAIVFSCSLLHEVLPVTRGQRYAMTTFLA